MKSRLERSTTNRVIGGVCGGIAEYLAVDPTLVRVVFVVTAFITAGLGVLGYIVLLILMPLPGHPAPFTTPTGSSGSRLPGGTNKQPCAATPRRPPASWRSFARSWTILTPLRAGDVAPVRTARRTRTSPTTKWNGHAIGCVPLRR